MNDFPWRLLGDGMHAWAIATAATVAAGCALVGTLLVVRRMSLMGDAISHAVLPGIVLAVLGGGRPGGAFVLVGAVIAALATVWLSQILRIQGGLAEDAGIGVAFTTLFALGVVLVTALGSRIDLDPGCILHGVLELVPFDTVSVAGVDVPRAFLTALLVFLAMAGLAVVTWPLQVFTAFDAPAAQAVGAPVGMLTYGLLASTALVTVSGFEAVGAILVVAMLVVPAAAAELVTRRLHHMATLAVLLAVLAALVGYCCAWWLRTSASGMIAVVLGVEYAMCLLLAPEDGLLARLWSRCRFRWGVACEDQLAKMWRLEEAMPDGVQPAAVHRRGLLGRLAMVWLVTSGSLRRVRGGWVLSDQGRARADVIVRSHRLWEAWLGRHARLPLDHLHPPAEWVEHHLGVEMRSRIEAEVGGQATDPHGRAIPPER